MSNFPENVKFSQKLLKNAKISHFVRDQRLGWHALRVCAAVRGWFALRIRRLVAQVAGSVSERIVVHHWIDEWSGVTVEWRHEVRRVAVALPSLAVAGVCPTHLVRIDQILLIRVLRCVASTNPTAAVCVDDVQVLIDDLRGFVKLAAMAVHRHPVRIPLVAHAHVHH